MKITETTYSEFNPKGRTWEVYRKVPDPPEEHPKPEEGARLAEEAEIPTAARSARKLAEEFDWLVQVTYARGTSMSAKGAPEKLVESIAVRMRKDDRRAVAVWERPVGTKGWTSELVRVWRVGEWPRPVGLAASKKNPDRELLSAYLINR